MVQWLYLAGVIVLVLVVWQFAVRPWLERRAGAVDERQILNRAAASDTTRNRQREFIVRTLVGRY